MSAEVRLPLCEMSAAQPGKVARDPYGFGNCMIARLPNAAACGGVRSAHGFSMSPLKLLINGARGRMGQTVPRMRLRRSSVEDSGAS